MTHESPQPSFQRSLSLPIASLAAGVLLVGASFLPLGNWVAQSQWTPADSAALDRISYEYKQSVYQSADRAGVSESEWEAQREQMQLRMQALQNKLDRAKSQPERWRNYLMGIGILLTAIGFIAHTARRS